MSHITYKNGRPARVGDMVIHPALGHTGELAEIIGNEGEGRVAIGASGIKYGADITEWLHADDKPKSEEPAKPVVDPKGDDKGKTGAGA